jgi:hypothetical protein
MLTLNPNRLYRPPFWTESSTRSIATTASWIARRFSWAPLCDPQTRKIDRTRGVRTSIKGVFVMRPSKAVCLYFVPLYRSNGGLAYRTCALMARALGPGRDIATSWPGFCITITKASFRDFPIGVYNYPIPLQCIPCYGCSQSEIPLHSRLIVL